MITNDQFKRLSIDEKLIEIFEKLDRVPNVSEALEAEIRLASVLSTKIDRKVPDKPPDISTNPPHERKQAQ